MYRLVGGATDRSDAVRSAGCAINRGAARNMAQKDINKEEMVNESRGGCRRRYKALSSLW